MKEPNSVIEQHIHVLYVHAQSIVFLLPERSLTFSSLQREKTRLLLSLTHRESYKSRLRQISIALPEKYQCPPPTPNISTRILPPLASACALTASVALRPTALPPGCLSVMCFPMNSSRNLLKSGMWRVFGFRLLHAQRHKSNSCCVCCESAPGRETPPSSSSSSSCSSWALFGTHL